MKFPVYPYAHLTIPEQSRHQYPRVLALPAVRTYAGCDLYGHEVTDRHASHWKTRTDLNLLFIRVSTVSHYGINIFTSGKHKSLLRRTMVLFRFGQQNCRSYFGNIYDDVHVSGHRTNATLRLR